MPWRTNVPLEPAQTLEPVFAFAVHKHTGAPLPGVKEETDTTTKALQRTFLFGEIQQPNPPLSPKPQANSNLGARTRGSLLLSKQAHLLSDAAHLSLAALWGARSPSLRHTQTQVVNAGTSLFYHSRRLVQCKQPSYVFAR